LNDKRYWNAGYRGITYTFLAFMFFQLLHPRFVSQKSGRKRFPSYFLRLSAMYVTEPIMHAATTAMIIASSVLISGCSGTVGSGSSGVGSSGVGSVGLVLLV
jgi:hypothetical protein